MDRETILKRQADLISEERDEECRWFWLSFLGKEGWRGGCFVLAPGFASAVARSHDLGLNPGGEVMGGEVSKVPPTEMQNRLLSLADLEAMGGYVTL